MRGPVAIIGIGAFGRLAASSLGEHTEVLAIDAREARLEDLPGGVRRASAEDLPSCRAVLIATPVRVIPGVLEQIASLVTPGTLVCDVASVKSAPCSWMNAALPEGCHVLGTHPLFGPETVREVGLRGQPIALCPVRIDATPLAEVREFLADALGLEVHAIDAEEHDRQMALVQAVTHLIGRAASTMELPELPLGTLAYKRLLQMKRNTERDAPELYDAIQRLNPHARDARHAFLEAIRALVDDLERLDARDE
ncbi:MAG: prephenate dehydrogenase [Planctomycetota bacterium]